MAVEGVELLTTVLDGSSAHAEPVETLTITGRTNSSPAALRLVINPLRARGAV